MCTCREMRAIGSRFIRAAHATDTTTLSCFPRHAVLKTLSVECLDDLEFTHQIAGSVMEAIAAMIPSRFKEVERIEVDIPWGEFVSDDEKIINYRILQIIATCPRAHTLVIYNSMIFFKSFTTA